MRGNDEHEWTGIDSAAGLDARPRGGCGCGGRGGGGSDTISPLFFRGRQYGMVHATIDTPRTGIVAARPEDEAARDRIKFRAGAIDSKPVRWW